MNIKKRLETGRPVYADFFNTRTMQQQRILVIRMVRERSTPCYVLHGINGEVTERLDDSRVCFS
jgi:hypothetical protein